MAVPIPEIPSEILRLMTDKRTAEEKMFGKDSIPITGTAGSITASTYYAPGTPLTFGTPITASIPSPPKVHNVPDMALEHLATQKRIADALEKIVERFC